MAVNDKALFLSAATDGLVDASITTAETMTTESICGMLGPSKIREPIQRNKHTNPPRSRVRSDTDCFIGFRPQLRQSITWQTQLLQDRPKVAVNPVASKL